MHSIETLQCLCKVQVFKGSTITTVWPANFYCLMNLTTETSIHLVTAIPGPRSCELQQRRATNVPRGVGSVLPIFIRRASGATIEDVDGNQLLDFTGGIGCQNAGHVPQQALNAIREQAEQFIHTCFMVTPYE